jgi:DNA end-binding protein Ku
VVLYRRERILMLEPFEKGLLATSLRYGYEVRDPQAYFEDIPDIELPNEMRKLAAHILETKAAHFDPASFEDRYENALVDLLKQKQAGQPAKAEAPSRPTARVINLMDALKRSVASEKAEPKHKRGSSRSAPARRSARPAARRATTRRAS